MNQVRIEDIIQMINKNTSLYHDFKVNLGEALIEYVSSDRTVDLNNFERSFENLSTTLPHSIAEKVDGYSYQPSTGVMIINESYFLRKDINEKNIYMQMVLDLLYNNGEIVGFGKPNLKALNKGLRETIAKNLVGEETIDGPVSDEYVYTQLVGRIVGLGILMEAFKQNKPEILEQQLARYGLDKVNELAEYNVFRNQSPDRVSQLARIQIQLYRISEMKNLNTDDIVNNMVFSSKVLDDGKHKNLDSMKDIIPYKVQNINANSKTI